MPIFSSRQKCHSAEHSAECSFNQWSLRSSLVLTEQQRNAEEKNKNKILTGRTNSTMSLSKSNKKHTKSIHPHRVNKVYLHTWLSPWQMIVYLRLCVWASVLFTIFMHVVAAAAAALQTHSCECVGILNSDFWFYFCLLLSQTFCLVRIAQWLFVDDFVSLFISVVSAAAAVAAAFVAIIFVCYCSFSLSHSLRRFAYEVVLVTRKDTLYMWVSVCVCLYVCACFFVLQK